MPGSSEDSVADLVPVPETDPAETVCLGENEAFFEYSKTTATDVAPSPVFVTVAVTGQDVKDGVPAATVPPGAEESGVQTKPFTQPQSSPLLPEPSFEYVQETVWRPEGTATSTVAQDRPVPLICDVAVSHDTVRVR